MEPTSALPPITGKGITRNIVAHMEQASLELDQGILVPSIYHIYLHPDDYDYLQQVFPLLIDDAKNALDKALRVQNSGRLSKWFQQALPAWARPASSDIPIRRGEAEWFIDFLRDPNGELNRSETFITSEFMMPRQEGYGAGQATKRLSTRNSAWDAGPPSSASSVASAPEPVEATRRESHATQGHSVLRFSDHRGAQSTVLTEKESVIGRGGDGVYVDVRIDLGGKKDVSREHCRIRRDPATGEFSIKDLSRYGTKVNGRPVRPSLEEQDDLKRDLNLWDPLPPAARIELADVIELDFVAGES